MKQEPAPRTTKADRAAAERARLTAEIADAIFDARFADDGEAEGRLWNRALECGVQPDVIDEVRRWKPADPSVINIEEPWAQRLRSRLSVARRVAARRAASSHPVPQPRPADKPPAGPTNPKQRGVT